MPDVNPPHSAAAPAVRAKPRRLRLGAGWLYRSVRNLLALAMLVEILLVLAPIPERVYQWLSVSTQKPGKADYILCLGGASDREGKAAYLWHRKIAPVLVVSNAPGAAEAMRNGVVNSGVPREKVLVDNKSYVTADHPHGIARLPGIDPATQRFVIVTDHTHTRRARACFEKAGYKHVVAYAGRYPGPSDSYWDHCKWRVSNIPAIVYECAALAKYWWEGHI